MTNSNKEWKLHTMASNKNLNDALQQQHHAAQFLALIGHHLIPQQPDDSNTNMEYISDGELLLGNSLHNGMRAGLQLEELNIRLLDNEHNVKKVIVLDGKSRRKVFDELKQSLSDLGVEVAGFKTELHYEIPAHQLDKGTAFSVGDKRYFIENTIYRHNAEVVLNEIANTNDHAEPVRVWPHHFDTGTFIAVSYNNKGEVSQSIGIGWAIPDSMVNEPYYYLSFWSEKPIKSLKKFSPLDAGEWMMPDWNGAILKHTEIFKEQPSTKQHELVKSFFNSGIAILTNHFKL